MIACLPNLMMISKGPIQNICNILIELFLWSDGGCRGMAICEKAERGLHIFKLNIY